MTDGCTCPRGRVPFFDGDTRRAVALDCPVHGWHGWYVVEGYAPQLWPLMHFGIRDDGVRPYGSGLAVELRCGCVVYYAAGSRWGLNPCYEHKSQLAFAMGIVPNHPAHCN